MFRILRVFPRNGSYFLRCEAKQLWTSGRVCAAAAAFVYQKRLDLPLQTHAKLAGRKWVPGGLNPTNKYPEFIASPKDNFPPVYEAKNSDQVKSVSEWAKAAREIVEDKLVDYGVILFRGMPVEGGEGFSQFLINLGYETMGYEGGLAVRQKVAAGVLTASDDLPEVTIQPHNEMAYSEDYPKKLFFYCHVAPEPGRGGETGLTRVRDIQAKLKPEVKEKFRKLGIKYHCYLPSKEHSQYKSWQETFFSEEMSDVEQFMKKMNYEYKWCENNALSYSHVLPAFQKHHKTGEELWFNHVHRHHVTNLSEHPKYADQPDLPPLRFPYHTMYGDGTEIEPEVMQHIRDVIWQVSVGFPLLKGDLLIYDNMLVQHSRTGVQRAKKIISCYDT
ncbi:taurine catabolism dioxygenase-like isoform X1 [Saccoglossus kowalevskii]